ncbi:hypothetical protein Dimus_037421, partial [Dionaea muscipula]
QKKRLKKMKEIKDRFRLGRQVIDEATAEGESGSERSFMMPRMKLKALRNRMKRFQAGYTQLQLKKRTKDIA